MSTRKNRIKTIDEIKKMSELSLVVASPLAFDKGILTNEKFSSLPEQKKKILIMKFENRRKSRSNLSSRLFKNERDQNLIKLEKATRPEYKKNIPSIRRPKDPKLESISEFRARNIDVHDMKKFYESVISKTKDSDKMVAAMDYLNQLEKTKRGGKKRTSQTRKKTRMRK